MSNRILYSIPTSSDYWTHETDDVPTAFFDRIDRELTAFVGQHWPDVEFSTRLVTETTSYNNRTRINFDDNPEDEEIILAAIDGWMSTSWPDWLAASYEEAA